MFCCAHGVAERQALALELTAAEVAPLPAPLFRERRRGRHVAPPAQRCTYPVGATVQAVA